MVGLFQLYYNRLRSGVGKEAMRKRGDVVERSFAHVPERGGMRRTWLRGRENIHNSEQHHEHCFSMSPVSPAQRRKGLAG
jgi:transposase